MEHTRVSFSIPKGFTMLTIYDMLGRAVAAIPIVGNKAVWKIQTTGTSGPAKGLLLARVMGTGRSISKAFVLTQR